MSTLRACEGRAAVARRGEQLPRFCKISSIAQHLVEGGEVKLNNRPVGKTSAMVHPGDELLFPQERGWRRITVLGIGDRRGLATGAQMLYEELSPPQLRPDG